MELQSKIRATTSCQGASDEGVMIDRFSDLPDDVANRILTFLCGSLRSLIQLGAVSKRSRQLHLSVPSLTISSSSVAFGSRWRARLLNYWDRYLFHRGDNKIEHFRICWSFDDRDHAITSGDEFFRITTLILNVVRCNVEVLELDFILNQANIVVLPPCIFHCHSLMQLCVVLNGAVIRSPSLSFSSYLRFLKLCDVKFEDDRFFRWISNSCKCLKDLHLFNVGGIKSITIESSSLETFGCLLFSDNCELRDFKISGAKIEDTCIHWQFYYGDDPVIGRAWQFYYGDDPVLGRASSARSLSISAPKLKKLTWCGNFLNHQHLGNLMFLEYARIFLWPGLEKFSNLFEVLCSLCMVRTLLLGEHTIKGFLVETSMPLPLCNIRDLTLEVTSLDQDFIRAMVYTFRGINTLNTLCIMSHLHRREEPSDDTEEENSETDTDNSDTFEEDDATEEEDNDDTEEENSETDTDNSDTFEEDDATEEEDNESDGNETDTDNCETTEEDDAYEEEINAPIFDVEFWKSQNLTFTNELKEVILEIVEGNDNAMELARYILEHAQNLQKMIIRHSPQHPNVVETVSKSKMISSATVIFKERRLCPVNRWFAS